MGRGEVAKAVFILICYGALSCAGAPIRPPAVGGPSFDLVIFHNNDGESQLLHAGSGLEDYGGIARFSSKLSALRAELPATMPSLFLSSGDNILPGPELRASIRGDTPFFDAIAINHLGYNALCLGNHDFDLGPDMLAEFITDVDGKIPFLAANLDVSMEPKLKALREKGRIKGHHIVSLAGGQRVGLIGIVTPRLPSISAPRKVKVRSDLASVVKEEIRALQDEGINKIILLSHLQDIALEIELVKHISGIDLVIGGGGDELLSNPKTRLVPGDEKLSRGPYPLMAMDKTGRRIPVVTTAGAYRYIGKLVVRFDAGGIIESVQDESGIFRVGHQTQPGGVVDDEKLLTEIVRPLKQSLEHISKSKLVQNAVKLDGRRSKVRAQETNLGNLIADAFLWYARKQAPQHDLDLPVVSLVNGGAIRNDSIIPKGMLTELDAFKVLPLPGFVSLVSEINPKKLQALMEYSFANIGGGGFLQVSGMRVEYDARRSESRVRSLVLDDGREIIKEGLLLENAPTISIATLSFLARGGGNIPLKGLDASNLAATYQQTLSEYLKSIKRVSKKQYRPKKATRLISINSK
jgi:5'-nucleotidase/UDP-sugar diphosphatase